MVARIDKIYRYGAVDTAYNVQQYHAVGLKTRSAKKRFTLMKIELNFFADNGNIHNQTNNLRQI